jgi:hypothetical protein
MSFKADYADYYSLSNEENTQLKNQPRRRKTQKMSQNQLNSSQKLKEKIHSSITKSRSSKTASNHQEIKVPINKILLNDQYSTSKRSEYSSTASKLDESGHKSGKWSKEEDEILFHMVPLYNGKNWRKIASMVKGRTAIQCLHRWTKILQPGLIKGPWTVEEDKKLVEWVKTHGATKWSLCADYIKGRNGKQCRERWFNSLNPKVKKGNWSAEEDYKILFLFKKFGGKWAKTASFFDCRTENAIKNRFYSSLRRISSEKKKYGSLSLDDLQENSNKIKINNSINLDSQVNSDDLLQYLPYAIKEATLKFMKTENLNQEELRQYEQSLLEEVSYKNNFLSIKEQIESASEGKTINLNINFQNTNNNHYTVNSNINNTQPNVNNISNITNNNCVNNNNYMNQCIPTNKPKTQMNYKNMDITALEREINDLCDNPANFLRNDFLNYENFDSQLDNIVEAMFDKNNIVANPNIGECNFCPVSDSFANNKINDLQNMNIQQNLMNPQIQSMWKLNCNNQSEKKDVYFSLIDQLNDLENLVKHTKKEMMKYEPLAKENNTRSEEANIQLNNFNCLSFDSLFKL